MEVEGEWLELLSLPDLVRAKKTQRDKDWPMIRRLVEQSVYSTLDPGQAAIRFWLEELRSPELLVDVATRFPAHARESSREAVKAAIAGDVPTVEKALGEEQQMERAADREYWAPLRAELEALRRKQRY